MSRLRGVIGSTLLLITPVALTLRDDIFCLAPPIGGERFAHVHLITGEMALLIAPRVALITFVRLNDFS